jgi:hypothetical protein
MMTTNVTMRSTIAHCFQPVPPQQLRQLGEVRRHAPRLVARQPIWSPSDATQRYVRNRGEAELRGVRLKRR